MFVKHFHIALQKSSSTKLADYGYDDYGRKNVFEWQTDHWSLSTEHWFAYDGWNLIKETTTDSGTSTDFYVWGLDVSGSLQGAGGIGGLLSKTNSLTSQTFLYTFDANGNVGQLVDSSNGTIVAHYEYDPFGKVLVVTGNDETFQYEGACPESCPEPVEVAVEVAVEGMPKTTLSQPPRWIPLQA